MHRALHLIKTLLKSIPLQQNALSQLELLTTSSLWSTTPQSEVMTQGRTTFNIVVVRFDDSLQAWPVECWFVALMVSHTNHLTIGHFSAGGRWRWCIATVDVERWCVQLTISCTVTITNRAQEWKTASHRVSIFFLCVGSGYSVKCIRKSTYSIKQSKIIRIKHLPVEIIKLK